MIAIAAVLTSYLIGSVPFSFLIGKLYGVDIRRLGSGNVGATNLKRAIGERRFGPFAYRIALLLDAAKGFIPAFLLADSFAVRGSFLSAEWLRVAMGIAAVLGHTFTVFLGFRGGKGVATSAGAVFAIAPVEACVALAVWIVVRAASGYVSAASCSAAISLPVAAAALRWGTLGGEGLSALAFGATAAILVVFRHRDNMVRLWRGTEPKADPILSFRKPTADALGANGTRIASWDSPPGAEQPAGGVADSADGNRPAADGRFEGDSRQTGGP